MLSIFQSEVSSLECQVAQLQAQIVQAQERINQLGECEVTAAGAIQALQYAVTRIAGLAPDAIASLKASVLNLFNSGDGGSQVGQPVSGGPLPIAPSPDFMCVDSHTSTPALVSAAPEPDIALQEQLVASAVMEVSATQPSDGTEHLEGQSCLLEDCPEEALQGQSVEVSCAYTYIKGLTLTHKGGGYEQWEAVEVPQAIAETAINEQVSTEPVGIIAEAKDLF